MNTKGVFIRLESILMCESPLQGARRLVQHVYQQLYEAVYNPANASLADTDIRPVLPRSGANGHSLRCIVYLPHPSLPPDREIKPIGTAVEKRAI